MINVVLGLLGFILMCVIQAMFINGLNAAMEKGMILDWFPTLVKKIIKNEYWHKPLFSCVRCQASFWGGITYWSFVLIVFGWHWQEIPVFIADVFVLVFLNFYLYKRS